MTNITEEILIGDLKGIGLKKGDIVYVHSSLKSIGWLENGPDTLTNAFLTVLEHDNSDGTLMVPTNTNSFVNTSPPFERDKTLSYLRTYPNSVWRHPLAKRSAHASHSSAAIGGKADFLIDNHDPADALGYDSPIYRMARSGGKILLIGVSQRSNTSVHLAEAIAGLYCGIPYSEHLGEYVHTKFPDGSVVKYKQTEFPGCGNGFNVIEEPLINKNLIKFGKIGNADSRLIDAGGMTETVIAMIKAQPDILLCGYDRCQCCPPRRKLLGL